MPKGIYERSPKVRAAAAANMRRVRISNGWPASAHAPATQAARGTDATRSAGWPNWRAANPEAAAAANSASGRVSTAVAWRCDECRRVIYGPAIGMHQRGTGHTGRTRITNPEENRR